MAPTNALKVPSLVYGTAWKKDATADLVHQALVAGFRGLDTAAQPKHYREDLVGAGLRSAMAHARIPRHDLHIQTKYTSTSGQDLSRPVPYDPHSSIADQVRASVASSLHNLRTSQTPPTGGSSGSDEGDYLDCLVLHSPFPSFEQTLEAWRAMEGFVPHAVRALGISNVYQLPVLRRLFEAAAVKPAVVQNRFHAATGYDAAIRGFCAENAIVYQSFWTLTANPRLLASGPVRAVAKGAGVSVEVAVYGLVIGLGERMSVLDGTTRGERMRADLEGLQRLGEWAAVEGGMWEEKRRAFEELLG